jgi:hypothetical protein
MNISLGVGVGVTDVDYQSGGGGGPPPASFFLLLADAVSYFLRADGASKIVIHDTGT